MNRLKANNQLPKFKHGFKTFAEKKSIDYRKLLGLEPYDFLCAFKLCKYLNIPLLTPYDVPNLEKEYLNNLLGVGSDNWSAVSIQIESGKYIIIHNNTHSPTRQQSNIMHELAHILCEHTSLDTQLYNLPASLRTYNESQEAEAIWLGGSLQLPRELLIHFLKTKTNIKTIAHLNTASEEMVQYRINVTGVSLQIKRAIKFR
jgi:hypothetical protein